MSDSPHTNEPKKRLKAGQRRQLLMAAALEMFSTDGYAATGTTAIATRAGVTRSVLYDHFESKFELLNDVLTAQQLLMLEQVAPRVGSSHTTQVRMRETIEAFLCFAKSYPESWQLLMDPLRDEDPRVGALWRQLYEDRVNGMRFLMAPDFQMIGLDPASEKVTLMLEMLYSSLNALVRAKRWRVGVNDELAVDAMMTLCWQGIGPLVELSGVNA